MQSDWISRRKTFNPSFDVLILLPIPFFLTPCLYSFKNVHPLWTSYKLFQLVSSLRTDYCVIDSETESCAKGKKTTASFERKRNLNKQATISNIIQKHSFALSQSLISLHFFVVRHVRFQYSIHFTNSIVSSLIMDSRVKNCSFQKDLCLCNSLARWMSPSGSIISF